MMHHEPEIQTLAKSPLGGQRFELFIRRHEMNVAPPPDVSSTPDKYVDRKSSIYSYWSAHFLFRASADRAWSGPGRLIDLAEEDYFNADDDDDAYSPSNNYGPTKFQQQQWARGSASTVSPLPANNTAMKRKRRPGLTSSTAGYRPPLKAPQLNTLVDYGDDDDDDADTSGVADSSAAQASGSGSASSPTIKSTSPKPPNRPMSPISSSSGPPPRRRPKDEDDDNSLEALAQNPRSRSQSPAPQLGPMRPSEKRRRTDEDDEDDELLVRVSKSKKLEPGNAKQSIGAKSKTGDDPPTKKIKVKFGSVGLAVASAKPNPPLHDDLPASEPGKKDEDTG